MKRADGPGLNGIRAGLAGDHGVEIPRLGRVDRVTAQVRTATEVYGKNKCVRVVFDNRLGIGPRGKNASQCGKSVGTIH